MVPALVKGAFYWNRFSPRGSSAIPRLIGRHLLRDQQIFIKTAAGAKLFVNLHNLDIYAKIYNQGGWWDAHVMKACQTILRSGDVFYDIGSNTGIFAVDAATAIKGLRVYAFEPQRDQAAAIRESVSANHLDEVECIECMLGKEDGQGALYLTSHSIHASSIPREDTFTKVDIPMRTLDSLMSDGMIAPDVIKIDVEGGEMAVLSGAQQMLAASKPSIVFEADENLERFGIAPNAIFEMISSFGSYRFFGIHPDGEFVPVLKFQEPANYLALSERHSGRMFGLL